MKRIYIIIFFCIGVLESFGQKHNVDFQTYKQWEEIDGRSTLISPDGNFVSFIVTSEDTVKCKLMISDIKGKSLRKVGDCSSRGQFVYGGKYFIYTTRNAINILNLTTQRTMKVNSANSLKGSDEFNASWISYKIGDTTFLYDLRTERTQKFGNTYYCDFNKKGNVFFVNNSDGFLWLDLAKKKTFSHSNLEHAEKIIWNNSGTAVAYFQRIGDKNCIAVFSPEAGAIPMINSTAKYDLLNDNNFIWSKDDRRIFFTRKSNEIVKSSSSIAGDLKIWNFHDLWTNRFYEPDNYQPSSFLSTINVKTKKVVEIESDSLKTIGNTPPSNVGVVVTRVNLSEPPTSIKNTPKYFIVNLDSGKLRFLDEMDIDSRSVAISPTGRFITWLNSRDENLHCYDSMTGLINNLTSSLPINSQQKPSLVSKVFVEAWTKNDKYVMVHDKYDVYQINPQDGKDFICLTGYLGRNKKFKFRIAEEESLVNNFNDDDEILLAALDEETKFNGIYCSKIGRSEVKVIITPEPNFIAFKGVGVLIPEVLKRARHSNNYLLFKQNASVSPNLFSLINSDEIHLISDIHPERNYNWLISEPHRFVVNDSTMVYGTMYKPQNFNSSSKYPVIFNYYEMLSDGCFLFKRPGVAYTGLDIPVYVSNGYCIFVPDILNSKGNRGEIALQCLEGAAKYVKKLNYVDSTRLGLQGHSFGGYITNYVAIRSSNFAAAQSSSGLSDFVREYGSFAFGDNSLVGMCEIGQLNMGTKLLENFDGYLKNSPIYFGEKLTTPLLMAHGSKDASVPIDQSISLFIALRRLNKPVWLLEYGTQNHVFEGQSLWDFSIRQLEFFDHFLRRGITPSWMIK